MRTRARLAFLGLLSLVLVAVLAARARADHKDERLGFSIQTPRGWTELPMSVDERWKVAKYLSDKTNTWTDKQNGWSWNHKANMEVIAFVAAATKERIKVEKKETRDGEVEWRKLAENPFKDYKEFLTQRYSATGQGGWYVSDEKERKVDDVAVTCYEIKVEKLAYDGPKRIYTWVYHVPDVDIAVQFEVLEPHADKLESEFQRCLRSFKQVTRKGGALYEAATGDFRFADLDKMTPDERMQVRKVYEKRSHEKASKNVPDGWTVKKMGRFLVINHADDKFAQRVVEQAEAVWDWLDKTFDFIGKGEYVREPIIRICKNWEERSAYYRGSNVFSVSNIEIVTCQDYSGSGGWEMEWVNREVMRIWFNDKDQDLSFAMPGWLGLGLYEFVGQLRVKNGKVDFTTDYWSRDEVRERKREKKLTPLRDLLVMGQNDFQADWWIKRLEGSCLVDYFVTGKASKQKRTKDLLPEYMRNVQVIAAEIKKEDETAKGKGKTKPKTEAEEDALFRDLHDGYKKKEKRLLEQAFERTFTGWTPSDWKKFEEAYLESL